MKREKLPSLGELAARRFPDYPVVSVFLDLRPLRARRPGLVYLNKELSQLEKSFPPRSKEAAWGAEEIRRIQEAVEESQKKKANFLAVFASSKEDFFEKFFWALTPESDLGIPHSFVRSFRPYLYPLALLADRLENFLLLVADLRKGELFRVEAGRITESWNKTALRHPETRREKKGAFDRRVGFARTTFSKRVEGHLKMHEEKYFKELAEQAVAWAQSNGTRSVILGADLVSGPPIMEEIRRLHSRLTIVLTPIDAKLSETKKLGLGILAFRKMESDISLRRVGELFSAGRRQAFFGAGEVLNILRESKRAGVLVLDEAFHQKALICGRCSALAPQGPSCPLCSGPVGRAAVENELVCLAAATGVEIEFVKDSEALAKKGGVGLLV